ncbi:MAG: hypothetical protein KIS67_19235 [Verrucomicrobiae bacterium]|nr:hypothetical protein [Verrucomicrobiae bacterium]
MNVHERNRLTKEILAGDEIAALRQRSLENGLAALRHRRRRRQVARLAACLAFSSLLVYGFLIERKPLEETAMTAALGLTTTEIASTEATRPAVKFITDDELFALFPDRAMALIGNPGRQQVLFFGASGTSERIHSDAVTE